MADKRPALNTVASIDLQKFMGTWYVIANIPTFIEEGAHEAIETYTWNEAEKYIEVDFKFRKDSCEGEIKSYPQKAWVFNTQSNSHWKIQFKWWLPKFDYYILDVAPDYSYTVIGVPNRKYIWIMARTPVLSDEIYNSLVAKAQTEWLYDVSKIQKVPQNCTADAKK